MGSAPATWPVPVPTPVPLRVEAVPAEAAAEMPAVGVHQERIVTKIRLMEILRVEVLRI